MAIYLKWHVCPCHELLVAQIQFVQILLPGRVGYRWLLVCLFELVV